MFKRTIPTFAFHPRLVRCELDHYIPNEQKAINSGSVIFGHVSDDEAAMKKYPNDLC